MNEELIEKMQKEYDSIISDFKELTKKELEGRGNGWPFYSGFVLGNVLSFNEQFINVENFREIYSKLQKELAVIVNQVADYYNLPKYKEDNFRNENE